MAVKTFSSEVLTSADTNTYLANSGLVYTGQATAAAGSTILSLDNCFNSTYTNYVIVYNITGYSAGPLYMRLRSGGADDSAASYAWSRSYFRWDGLSSGAVASMTDTVWTVGYCGGSVTTIENTVNVYNPNVADRTSYNCQMIEIGANTAGSFNQIANGQKQTVTQYTGLSLVRFSTNTFAGTVTVYGYRKG